MTNLEGPALKLGGQIATSAAKSWLRRREPVDFSPLADLEVTVEATGTELLGKEKLGPGV